MGKSPDCVIVGGGVIGLSVARRLACEGLRIGLFERGTCGGEASWAGAGILAPCNPHRNDPVFHLQQRSLYLYPQFSESLRAETGVDPEYDPCGELQLLFTPNQVQIARSDERAAAGRTMPDGSPILQIHSPVETRLLEPAAASDILGAIECRQTAQVRNPHLIEALRQGCLRIGVEIHEHSAVNDIVVKDGRAEGVVISQETISCGTVILCAGAWSSGIGDCLSALLPVHPVRGQIVLLKLALRPFHRIISQGKTYLVPRRDGHVLLGSTEEPEAGFNKRTTAAGISGLIERGLKLVPTLEHASVVATWAGLRPGTADDRPYLGPVPGIAGLIAATGHFRAGITLAPVTAEVVAAIVHGTAYDIDLSSCQPGRT